MLRQQRSFLSDEEGDSSSQEGASSVDGGVDVSTGTWQTSGDEALSRRSSSVDGNMDASIATWQRSLLQQPELFAGDRLAAPSPLPGQVAHDAVDSKAAHRSSRRASTASTVEGSAVPNERLRELARQSRLLSEESSKLKVDRDRLLMDNEELEAENERLRAMVMQHCSGTEVGEERYESPEADEHDDEVERFRSSMSAEQQAMERPREPSRGGHYDDADSELAELEFSRLQDQLESAHLAQSASQDQVRRVSQMLEEAVEEAKSSSLEIEGLRRQLAEQERKAAEWERQYHQERGLVASLKAELERERRASGNSHRSRALQHHGEGIFEEPCASDVRASVEAADKAWQGLLRLL